MKTVIATIALICLLVLPALAQPPYQVGDHVDNFTLPDSYGNMVSLSDYADKIVLMTFWYFG